MYIIKMGPTIGQLWAHARLVSWNCFMKSVCVYVSMHVAIFVLPFCTHVSKPFTWSLKAACIQIIKAKQSLYYTYAQVSSALKVCRHFTTKKQCTRPHGDPGNVYIVDWKVGVTRTYENENKEQPGGFAGKNLKSNTMESL